MIGLSTLLSSSFPDLTEHQKDQFDQLPVLYKHWNSQINVISRKDMDQFAFRHVLHSLGIAKVIQFKPKTSILDVGTGGGFPGIPLAILFPESRFLLVDSIGKKIKVVQEVAQELGLDNVHAMHERAENIDESFDFVVSRAVTRMNKFIPWVKNKINKESKHDISNGILYLKGGDLEEELNETRRPYRLHALSNFFEDDFFLSKFVVEMELV